MRASDFNNPKALHNLTWIPIFLIGMTLIIIGIRSLFGFGFGIKHIDSNLILYGTGFGFLGIILMVFVQKTRLGTRINRAIPQALLVLLLIVVYINIDDLQTGGLTWILFGMTLLLVTSIIASQRLNKFD
ncbi:hypothetical protein ACFL46_00815 [Candidatus Neomarinimicrobiota bacterium]